ncbi:hypothetical protein [uncultured Brevibacillus sp.]|uniref:hypothetical protein n=1 Tax=uncultured Brevibacillus sp. TaxID=169970 RepID=UPI00259AC9C2|nr:hypothetical protein [uncultured Brevibacillus sp.]
MFREFEEFLQAESKIGARIDQLSSEIEQKKADQTKAEAAYKKMMVDDSAGIKTYSTSELNKAKMRADELASEIEVAQERLQMVSTGKSEKLYALLDNVKHGWERETQQLNLEIQEIFKAAREYRAKLTLEIQKGHERYLKAQELKQALNRAEQIIGMNYSQQSSHLGIPDQPLLKEYHSLGYSPITDKCVIPSEDELVAAYRRGKVPPWISHYAATGEVVTNDDLNPKEEKPTEQTEKSAGLLEKLFGRSGQKVQTYRLLSTNPKEALENWKRKHPTATIVSIDQLNYGSGYEIQYTLPE